jgi:hypothetical protein
LGDAGPTDLIWFEDSKRSKVEAFLRSDECRSYNDALEETAAVIDGLESPPGMELLATVDWMVDDRLLGLAIDRLTTAQIEK